MSVLFPKVNKAPEWNWRPIYYDPKKDEMDRKLKAYQQQRQTEEKADATGTDKEAAQANYSPKLHRGSFRESHDDATSFRDKNNRQSRLTFWVVLLILLLFFFYWLL